MTTVMRQPESKVSDVILTPLVAGLVGIGILLPPSPVTQLVVLCGVPLLLGGTIVNLIGIRMSSLTSRWLVILATGLVGYLMIGAIAAFAGPIVGISRPLDRWPMVVVWFLVVAAISIRSIISGNADPSYSASSCSPSVHSLVTGNSTTTSRALLLMRCASLPSSSWSP